MSQHESKHTFFPKVPAKQPQTKEFSFPLGAFMEVKRQLVTKQIPPQHPVSQPPPPPPPPPLPPKPTSAIPEQPIPQNRMGTNPDSRKRAIQQKLSENHTSKLEGRGKGTLPGKTYRFPERNGKR